MPVNRRTVLHGLLAAAVAGRARLGAAQAPTPAFSAPIGLPGRALGDGFFIRHGYATENTWYNPGYWHTGEDWYLIDGDTAGAGVFAIADGEVVFAGSDYPGRVVIVRHAPDLYSMYGHLDFALEIEAGQAVRRGDRLGAVGVRSDGVPNHLHFEVRTFLTTPEVNGDSPRYGFNCGVDCPPGPGYWPIDAPEHPSAMGWRNPTHVIARRGYGVGPLAAGAEVVVAESAPPTPQSWGENGLASPEVGGVGGPSPSLRPGERLPLLEVRAGAEDTTGTSAEAYALSYRVRGPAGGNGWVQAAAPSTFETGSDGRPSSVGFSLLPPIAAS